MNWRSFLSICSYIPSSPVYGVFISQPIRYARACSSYVYFIVRARRLSWLFSKLLKQGYLLERLKSSFRKFNGRYGDLRSPSHECLTVTFHPIRLSTNFMTLIPSLTVIELWMVSMEHLQLVWHTSSERLPLRTPGSVLLWGACLCSDYWD